MSVYNQQPRIRKNAYFIITMNTHALHVSTRFNKLTQRKMNGQVKVSDSDWLTD